jgi:hypothetical protein
VVYLERKRIAARDAAEAAGESLWTEDLDQTVRGKLIGAWRASTSGDGPRLQAEVFTRRIITVQLGIINPSSVESAFLVAPVDLALSYVDAVYSSLTELSIAGYSSSHFPEVWQERVSTIFQSHRIKFKFVSGEVVPLASEELHAEVIERVLALLHGRQDLKGAQAAYQDALGEIANGKPDNAITDAGTALQEALKALGCSGRVLGDQIKEAKKSGLLGPRDAILTDGIEKVMIWAAAERNSGEAHSVSDATRADAWLMVHIVGALIVRLADGPRVN